MSRYAQELVEQLKLRLGDYEVNDDDFHEPEEIAEVGSAIMFDYFRNELGEQDVAKVERFAAESNLFLSNLIQVGEIVIADEQDQESSTLSWLDLRDLAQLPATNSVSAQLANNDALRLDIPTAYMTAASSPGIEVRESLPIGVEIDVFEDDGKLIIDLKSTDASLSGEVFGYCLRGQGQPMLGIALIQQGDSGLISASVELDRSTLSGEYSLNLVKIEPADLGRADFDLIHEAIARDAGDGMSITAWRGWVDRVAASDDGQGLSPLLDSIRECLHAK